ncbi:MAG: DUF4011 domain-containing protein [Chitinophagales bacterium]|nr:DUF4011 domain-containing protein [Chitinophagales bacterium]
MLNTTFLDKLLLKLKSGDARSIHLNALPGNYARLDIYDLVNIEQSLHLKFLELLLTQRNFKFEITVDNKALSNKSEDEKNIIKKLIKKLNYIYYQEQDELAEHGYHSFGFGYPLLLKRDSQKPDKIIKAPLFIWYLQIERSNSKQNTWIISRDENHPLIFNEPLKSYLESNEQIKVADTTDFVEEEMISETQLLQFCENLLLQLNTKNELSKDIATILPCTNKEAIEILSKEHPWIRFSGVFGLYKTQKQSIIADVEQLIQKINNNDLPINDTLHYEDAESLTPIVLDPSQENIINQLKEHNEIIIQGPPGTGKSQTLTAIITNALYNQKKVLVVCEKKTALEVLYNNLQAIGLEQLAVMIEDVYTDRKNIVQIVRDKIENELEITKYRQNEFEDTKYNFIIQKEEINHRINIVNETYFGDDTMIELLSLYYDLIAQEQTKSTVYQLLKNVAKQNFDFNYEEYKTILREIDSIKELSNTVTNSEQWNTILNNKQITQYDSNTIINSIQKCNYNLNTIKNNINQYKNNSAFTVQKGFKKWLNQFLSLFSAEKKNAIQAKNKTIEAFEEINQTINQYKIFNYTISNTIEDNILAINNDATTLSEQCQWMLNNQEQLDTYLQWQTVLSKNKYHALYEAMHQLNINDWTNTFKAWYYHQVLQNFILDNKLDDKSTDIIHQLQQNDETLKKRLAKKILATWQELQQQLIATKDLAQLKYLYNQRKNKQYNSKNSLRKIVHDDVDFFTTIFPVVLVNPSVAASIIPLEYNLFDFIILDEASQLKVEETYATLLRGKTKIISGDKHQMPPSSYFGNAVVIYEEENDDENESFLADSQSLLEYAEDTGYQSHTLDFHYRSQHHHLIEFSNTAFYQSKLIPLPPKKDYQAITFHAINGVYQNGINEAEAKAIVTTIFDLANTTTTPSIGIATFNIHQRNLILDLIYETATQDEANAKKLELLLANGLFVKNLENIQGDERDILLISTTFGLTEEGKFRQNFGPLTQEKGYKLLNVIITRAKKTIQIFSSIPEQFIANYPTAIQEKGNTGKGIFYAYLAFVKAISQQNEAQKQLVLNTIAQERESKNNVINNNYSNYIDIIIKTNNTNNFTQNYQLGGYTLPLVNNSENSLTEYSFENSFLYKHQLSYRYKLHLQKILQNYNINTNYIWFYDLWQQIN